MKLLVIMISVLVSMLASGGINGVSNSGDIMSSSKDTILFRKFLLQHRVADKKKQVSVKNKKKQIDIKKLFKKLNVRRINNNKALNYMVNYDRKSYRVGKRKLKAFLSSAKHSQRITGVNMALTLATIETESGYRSKLYHPRVAVKIYGKRVRTRAMGAGGVIYELHKVVLNKHGIRKKDLLHIRSNTLATALILKQYGAKRNIKKALGKYYGKNNRAYANKVYKRYLKYKRLLRGA